VPRETFQDDLDRLRADVVAMGEAVLAQLDDGLTALETGDAALAREVIDGDAAINERYLDLEARCVDLFALQQPVAGDLRFVAAAFKILTDLERVGDLATNLGQYALAAGDEAQSPLGGVEAPDGAQTADGTEAADDATAPSSFEVAPTSVTGIGRDAHAMLADALAAFEAGDADACVEIAERDDDLDVLCQRAGEDVVRELLARGSALASGGDGESSVAAETDADPDGPAKTDADPGTPTEWDVEAALDEVSRVLLTIRDLERVGDHAVNVAGRTYYMVEHDPALIV
jgi:phosphate transport system protein